MQERLKAAEILGDAQILEKFELVTEGDSIFLIDTVDGAGDIERVFPHFDESNDLLRIAQELNTEFDTVVDAFRGGGHAMLRIVSSGLAQRGIGIDKNPRASHLADLNSKLNNVEGKVTNLNGSVEDDLPESDGRTLFVANPPFALSVQGVTSELMRNGGVNGLQLTESYIENAVDRAEPGDYVIGVAYSRINRDGVPELESILKKNVSEGGRYEISLVEGAKLWREYDGLKRQSNPMQIDNLKLKASPDDIGAIERYEQASAAHKSEGWEQLGYFQYVISFDSTWNLAGSAANVVKQVF